MPASQQRRALTLVPLVAIVYHEVSGGPFGVETCVSAAGPFLTLVGFATFPLIWSVPEAIITAELCSLFPENSGYVAWSTAAFGRRVGWVQGALSWFSGVADNALYPVLLAAYAQNAAPELFDKDGYTRAAFVIAVTFALTAVNFRGIECVGIAAVVVAVVALVPFVAFCIVGIFHGSLSPSNWLLDRHGEPFELRAASFEDVRWRPYLSVLFWNLNYWDSVSTLAGEVSEPGKTFPRALSYALLLVYATYLLPLLVGIGVSAGSEEEISRWKEGYFASIAKELGGWALTSALLVASVASNAAQFITEMSSDSYQLAGMAERGMLPRIFAARSRYDTPYVGIIASASGILLLGFFDFTSVVDMLNLLYVGSIVVEFAAWLVLRRRHVRDEHSASVFRIKASTPVCVLMLTPAFFAMGLVTYFSSIITKIVLIVAILVALSLYEVQKWSVGVDNSAPDDDDDDDARPREASPLLRSSEGGGGGGGGGGDATATTSV